MDAAIHLWQALRALASLQRRLHATTGSILRLGLGTRQIANANKNRRR